MCSTIRPCPVAHRFSDLQVGNSWKHRTNSSHQNFILGYLLRIAPRSGDSKCVPLSAGVRRHTVSVSSK